MLNDNLTLIIITLILCLTVIIGVGMIMDIRLDIEIIRRMDTTDITDNSCIIPEDFWSNPEDNIILQPDNEYLIVPDESPVWFKNGVPEFYYGEDGWGVMP